MTNMSAIGKTISILILLFMIILNGCDTTGTGFERSNPSDGKGEGYSPNLPADYVLSIQGTDIRFNWGQISFFEDGFLVEKSVTSPATLEEIAVLPSGSTSFVDRSGIIGEKTYYRISPFVGTGDSREVNYAEVIEIEIPLLEEVTAEYDGLNYVGVNWSVVNNFAHFYSVERKASNRGIEFIRVDSLDNQQRSTLDEVINVFDFGVEYRVSAMQLHGDKEVVIGSLVSEEEPIFTPQILDIDVVDEKIFELAYSIPHFEFIDSIEVQRAIHSYAYGHDTVFETVGYIGQDDPSPFQETSQKDTRLRYHYRLAAKSGELSSTYSNVFEIRSPSIYYPTLRVKNTPDNNVFLSWYLDRIQNEDEWYQIAHEVQIQRSVNNGEFETIHVMNTSDKTYIDTDLDTQSEYSYRLRTFTSAPSEEVTVRYTEGYTKLDSVSYSDNLEFENSNFSIRSPDELDAMVLTHSPSWHNRDTSSDVYIIDNQTLSVSESISSSVNHSIRGGFYDSNITSDGNKVLWLIGGDYDPDSKYFDLEIYDRDAGTYSRLKNVLTAGDNSYYRGMLAVSETSNLVAVSARESLNVNVINIDTGEVETVIEYPLTNSFYANTNILHVSFHPLLPKIVVYHYNGVDIWDIETGDKEVLFTEEWPEYLDSTILKFDREGNHLVTVTNGLLRIFDFQNKSLINSKEYPFDIHSVNIKPDGNYLSISYYRHLYLINFNTLVTNQEFEVGNDKHIARGHFQESSDQFVSISSSFDYWTNIHDSGAISWSPDTNWYVKNDFEN